MPTFASYLKCVDEDLLRERQATINPLAESRVRYRLHSFGSDSGRNLRSSSGTARRVCIKDLNRSMR